MTLVKLIVADDGKTIVKQAWANPKRRVAGDATEDGFVVLDVSQKQAEIDAMQRAVLDGAVTLVDQQTADFTVIDKEAIKSEAAATHTVTKVVSGKLVVNADYVPPVEVTPKAMPTAEMQAINALGIQFANYVASQKEANANA